MRRDSRTAKERTFASVDEYVGSFPRPVQEKLKELRRLVRGVAPEAEERISYQMAAFFHKGNRLYLSGYERHIGFYPGSSAVSRFRTELSRYKHAAGSVQFPLDEPLPAGLIRRIVGYRLGTRKGRF